MVVVTNNLKSKFTVTSANIEVSGPSGGQPGAAQMGPFTVPANEMKEVHSHDLDDAVSGFRKKTPKAEKFYRPGSSCGNPHGWAGGRACNFSGKIFR